MDDKKLIESKVESKPDLQSLNAKNEQILHTNPILQKMLRCNVLSEKMKFKFKDLFR